MQDLKFFFRQLGEPPAFIVVAVLAGHLPGRRATCVNSIEALRAE